MAWDTPSVNRARRPAVVPRAVAPVQRVSFGEIAWWVLFALIAAALCAWFAAWLLDLLAPRLGPFARGLVQAAAASLGGVLAARVLWRTGGTGRTRRWRDSRIDSDYGVAGAIVEAVVEITLD